MSTTMKHTPGPWRNTVEGFIVAVNGGFVPIRTPFRKDAFTDGPTRSDHKEETLQANARLIASAPDLLEALEGALLALRRSLLHIDGDHNDAQFVGEWIDSARAAIAKATGKE